MTASVVCLAALGILASIGFGYLFLAAHYQWGQQPPPRWDGVERRAIRGQRRPS